jgi:hypothetical protein
MNKGKAPETVPATEDVALTETAPAAETAGGPETAMASGLAREETQPTTEHIVEPQSPVASPRTQQKRSWMLKMHRPEREPGRISKIEAKPLKKDGTDSPTVEPDLSAAAKDAEVTPTGATMAGDGPATINAPEAMPATERAIDEQATTPIEERPRPSTAKANGILDRTSQDKDERPPLTPSSPSKKRFSRLMGKLKRNKTNKDEPVAIKKDSAHDAETSSFTGGAKLTKPERDSTDPAAASPAVAAGITAAARDRSPSISSMSDSDEEIEERGRSITRLDHTGSKDHTDGLEHAASQVAAIKDSDSEGGDFEEARDRFDSELAPPEELLSKKHAESPVRDSKFVENI